MHAKELGSELYVARFVDAVDVAEAGGDAEEGGDCGEGFVDVEDVFGLGVEGVVVDVFVVDAVFFAAGYADFLCGGFVLALWDGSSWVEGESLVGELKGVTDVGERWCTISSHCFMGEARLRYFAVVSTL